MPWVMLAFVIWMTLNSLQAPFPDWSWPLWDQTMRIFAFVFLVFVLLNTKVRIHAMIWVLVISVGFYGVKGGMFTIVSGGHAIVYGPPDTIISDNNNLALATVMTSPLILYLRDHTANRWLRVGLLCALGLQIIMVFGSYSRGGMIALAPMLVMVVVRSERRIAYALAITAAIAIALLLMPDVFWERMQTISDASQDDSFHGRVIAWQVAMKYAADHFPFGAGFSAPQLEPIFNHYFPNEMPHAAHSIFFQVLGEHGYPGLALYLLMLALAARNSFIVVRQTRNRPGLQWAHDLGKYIQISLASFCVGGAALSIAYFDGFLLLLALLSTLRELTALAAVPARLPRGLSPLMAGRLPDPKPR
jgi:putative inorganic carbon (HCO3(-)) transporter